MSSRTMTDWWYVCCTSMIEIRPRLQPCILRSMRTDLFTDTVKQVDVVAVGTVDVGEYNQVSLHHFSRSPGACAPKPLMISTYK